MRNALDEQTGSPARTWGAEALVAVAVALFFVPIWRYGSDAGWIGCGSLFNKTGPGLDGDGVANGCEVYGAYRRRIVVIAMVLVCAAVVTLRRVLARRRGDRSVAVRRFVVYAGVSLALLAGAWATNDARPRPHPFADIEVDFTPDEVPTNGRYEITVTGENWNAPTPVVFTTCASFPDRCNRDLAVVIDPVDGSFSTSLTTGIARSGTVVAVFDEAVTFYGFQRICPEDGCGSRREHESDPDGG